MRYAKREGDGLSLFRGRILRFGGRIYANPSEKTLKDAGFLPYEEEDLPNGVDPANCERRLVEEGGRLLYRWYPRTGKEDTYGI